MQAERGGTYSSIDVPGSMLTEVDSLATRATGRNLLDGESVRSGAYVPDSLGIELSW